MKSGLSALIHPHTIEEFFASYELNEPFVVHDNNEHMKVIRDLPFLESLEKLLTSWPSLIQAHLPDVRDESSSIDTNTKDAQKLFNNGMGLLFNETQTISPLLVEWLEEIKKNLGLSAMTYARCLVYATPDGKGTAPHFDQNINFVYQVHGTKVWHMAPNTDLENPLTRHTMGTMPDPEMMGYLEAPLPTKMPANAETYELKPGSILFVPRGYWHSTEAEGDALALNFTFTAPTWLDLFTAALRSRLAMSPDWRETANGVSDPDFRHLAEKKFDLLLGSLVQDLPHWRAGDILDAIEPQEN
ncbi:cupin domain-containing protein [Bacteriovorax sp. PP10]|uniref:Cupin domain-containing protein n=1 Tax=Bacteriovorax antarcticus TaxID=3088717 RepID=A0ABU5VX42_9BACT|nr:cupin domain-containing protein [Bacteriovorax sp. PP10]MEA9357621.1 cupin domain-containing protein [Bacteriovorax sp. PP10]